MTGPLLRQAPVRRPMVPARTVAEKVARVTTLAELDGFVAGLAHRGREPSADDLAAIALRRAELMRGAGR